MSDLGVPRTLTENGATYRLASYTLSPMTVRNLRNHLLVATRKVAREALSVARALVPVDTGQLKSSLDADDLGISQRGGSLIVEALTEYMCFVELGTRYQEPQPYMKPAYLKAKRSRPTVQVVFIVDAVYRLSRRDAARRAGGGLLRRAVALVRRRPTMRKRLKYRHPLNTERLIDIRYHADYEGPELEIQIRPKVPFKNGSFR